ncbi:MAG: FtsX-like permease family protein [Actinomycetota bacterium]|nr:FtsX-like permease family protein [Actinomycetota bacterium]
MLKLTLRQLLSHKIRFAMTTFAVVLGVSFVVGSFTLADSLREVFGTLGDDIVEGTDAEVRGVEQFEGDASSRQLVDESVLDVVRGVDGVEKAAGEVNGSAVVLDAAGEQVAADSFPQLIAWEGAPPGETDGNLTIIEGAAARGEEIAVDVDTAADEDITIGDTLTVRSAAETRELTVSGLVRFGDEDTGLAGAALWIVDPPTAQALLGLGDSFQTISVQAADGVDPVELTERIGDQLGADYEVVTSEAVAEEFSDEFSSIIDIFRNALLAFALVALVVSAFLINNTFNIVLGQRIRELALLRALGAASRQVTFAVVAEAVAVGLIASLAGVGFGLVVALGLKALIASQGGGLPDGPLVVAPLTWVAAFVVGVGVTTVASLAPARKASTIPPVAAMRDGMAFGGASGRRRFVIGTALLAVGAAMLGYGLFGDPGSTPALLTMLGGGALGVFVAVAALSPLVARPVVRTLGAPLARVFGTAGRLSRENAARSPQRTAATASALMVGLALVAMAATVGESLKQSFLGVIDDTITADVFVTDESFVGASPMFVDEVSQLPEIEAVTGFRFGQVRVDGDGKEVLSADGTVLDELIDPNFVEGGTEGLTDDGLLLHEDPATERGLHVGDTVEVVFAETGARTLTVTGIYEDASILGNWLIDQTTFEANFPPQAQVDSIAAATFVEGTDLNAGMAAVDAVGERYPEVKIEDRAEFRANQKAQIDQTLYTISILLVFAVIIAALGIANTMALSVFERTRELGLLRAVGMSRRQLRRMVRWESVIVAVFGAVLGVGLGVVFGIGAVSAMPDSVMNTFAIPTGTLIVILVGAGIVGLVAAYLPARRAGKLDVLRAIAHD